MNDQDWKNVILNTALKSAMKQIYRDRDNNSKVLKTTFFDIDNVSFVKASNIDDNTTSSQVLGSLSFDYITYHSEVETNNNKNLSLTSKEVIRVSGLKIINDYFIVGNSFSPFSPGNKIFPVISFALQKQQDSLTMTVLSSKCVFNGKEYPYKTIENFGSNLGKVDGQNLEFSINFTKFNNGSNDYSSSKIFDSVGYEENYSSDANDFQISPIKMGSPIFFSKLEGNNSFTWEVYNLNLSPK